MFKQNLRRIAEINAANLTYWAAPNQYTAMSWTEFTRRVLGAVRPTSGRKLLSGGAEEGGRPAGRRLQQTVANAKDWSALGGVTGVRNQGTCGACWAFAAVAAIESRLRIQTGQSWELSEQQLIDCANTDADPSYWSTGCEGGWPTHALNYASRWAVTTETNYPFA